MECDNCRELSRELDRQDFVIESYKKEIERLNRMLKEYTTGRPA